MNVLRIIGCIAIGFVLRLAYNKLKNRRYKGGAMEIKCNSSEKYFIKNAIRAEIKNFGCPFDRDYCDEENRYCEKCINKRITWIEKKE